EKKPRLHPRGGANPCQSRHHGGDGFIISTAPRRPNQAFLLSFCAALHTPRRHIDRTKSRFHSGNAVVTMQF
ncbi:hypothetical protein, partial [Burkholderia multivorans]|uniref:hypothetical protein n=1 Tax=Burkholderia multivorans TaxID=87883 RepID=UPI0021C01654